MSDRTIELPAAVHNKLRSLGADGERWLADLGNLVSTIERDWGVRLVTVLNGGSEACVAHAVDSAGAPCVVKLLLPSATELEHEITALRIASGRGYATLLRYDLARHAMLLEPLGAPLGGLGLAQPQQMRIICQTLQRSWVQVPETEQLTTGAQKSAWLRDFIAAAWQSLGQPCSSLAVFCANEFAQARIDAFDPTASVLVHGDAHGGNALLRPGCAPGDSAAFKLVDPDGLLAEPACDLAVPMRDWSDELLAGDALRLGRERCEYLSWLTDVDPIAIWQWGFLERMSTGLYLLQLGFAGEGRSMLRVAEAWAAEPSR